MNTTCCRQLLGIVILLIAPSLFASSDAPIQARLVIPDAAVLPGMPYEMWVELHNSSSVPVEVNTAPTLTVTRDRLHSFEIHPGDRLRNTITQAVGELVTIKPNETKTILFPISEAFSPTGFFADHRLSPPGQYALSMRFNVRELSTDYPTTAAESIEVMSNEATVVHVEPTGDDAAVWHRMQSVSEERWSIECTSYVFSSGTRRDCISQEAQGIFDEIMVNFPTSGYVPYVLLVSESNTKEYRDKVRSAIERFPNTPVIEPLYIKAYGYSCGASRANNDDRCGQAMEALRNSKRPTTKVRLHGYGTDYKVAKQ